ncbi:hypothetical protein SLS62_009423 [Diatrype stigma]|uniref:Amidase domain-containing protein n=1 Tax=Diatrype stigma TaxID=117547 RepID=A0AAN9YKI5_9PEZI
MADGKFLYHVLTSLTPNGLWKQIAVPSRLYAKPAPEKPLAGARMGIKDIFRLEGTQLTMMSRAWTELYGPYEESAEYTKKLIELGAVIVGKTKMTSFASPEEPTDQWVDFHCPVNPRGDQYQSPSSSSTGAGISLAGCWKCASTRGLQRALFFAAQLQLYIDEGTTNQFTDRNFDTVGQFGRSLDDLHYIVSNTFDNIHQTFSDFPFKLLYPVEFYPLANEKQQALTEEFISVLEDFLGIKRTPFNLVEEWEKNPPKEAAGVVGAPY